MGRGGEAGVGTGLCIAMSSITVFVSCFLLGYSFDTLKPEEYALMFNRNTRQLECDKVYGAARGEGSRRYFTGLGRGFYEYRFPLQARTILFSSTLSGASSATIVSKTNEGATVTLDVALQYTLPRDPTSLCNLILNYGSSYETYYTNYVRAVTRDTIGNYLVSDMWTQRPQISAVMRSAIAAELTNHYATLVNFQMLSLQIPSQLQAEIENTTVQEQGIGQAQLNLQARRVAAITSQLQAQVQATVTVIDATATANATLVEATSRATIQNVTAYSEALGYQAFKRTFNLTNAEVLELAYIDALLNTDADRVAINIQAPASVTQGF